MTSLILKERYKEIGLARAKIFNLRSSQLLGDMDTSKKMFAQAATAKEVED